MVVLDVEDVEQVDGEVLEIVIAVEHGGEAGADEENGESFEELEGGDTAFGGASGGTARGDGGGGHRLIV